MCMFICVLYCIVGIAAIKWDGDGDANDDAALKHLTHKNLLHTTRKLLLRAIIFHSTVPVYTMEALIGETIYLPCNVSTHEVGDDVILVLWYREDKGTPIYRYERLDTNILCCI